MTDSYIDDCLMVRYLNNFWMRLPGRIKPGAYQIRSKRLKALGSPMTHNDYLQHNGNVNQIYHHSSLYLGQTIDSFLQDVEFFASTVGINVTVLKIIIDKKMVLRDLRNLYLDLHQRGNQNALVDMRIMSERILPFKVWHDAHHDLFFPVYRKLKELGYNKYDLVS